MNLGFIWGLSWIGKRGMKFSCKTSLLLVTPLLGIAVLITLYLVYGGNYFTKEDDYQTIRLHCSSQEAETIKASIELQLKESIKISKINISNLFYFLR